MNTDDLILKLYNNPSELEKMAQEKYETQKALNLLEKIANEASLDLSNMSEQEKLELYNFLSQELQAQEAGGGVQDPAALGGQEQLGQPNTQAQLGQTQPQIPAQPQVAQAVPQEQVPGVSEDFQQKVAENMYFSELFGKNAARHYFAEVQALQKQAAEEEVKDDKGEGGSPTFEAMAKERAMKMKGDSEKNAAFDTLLTKRAEELLASGKV